MNRMFKLGAVITLFLSTAITATAAEWDILWTQTYDTAAHYDYANDTDTAGQAIYIVGAQYYNKDLSLGGQGGYLIERRNTSSGSLVWRVSGNNVGGLESAHTVVADENYVYIGIQQGFNHNGAGGAWRIEKRNASNGNLVWVQVIDPTGYSEAPTDMALSGGYLYIVGIQNGGGGSSPNAYWRLEKRNASNGALVWADVYRYGSRNDYPFAMTVSGSSIFVVGRSGPASSADYQCVIERRNTSNGAVVWTRYHNPTARQDDCRGVSSDGTTVYVTGQQYGGTMFVQRRNVSNGSLVQNVTSPGGNFFQARGLWQLGTHIYATAVGSGMKKINTANLATVSTGPINTYGYGVSGDASALYNLTGSIFNFDAWTVRKIDLAVVLPNQPPTATITTPASNATVASGATVSFAGTGTDPDGTVTARQWRDGACASGTLLSGAASFTKNDFTVGAHTVYLRVQDNDGAWSPCDSVTVTVSASTPTATLSATNCAISANASTCNSTVAWTINGATNPNTYNATRSASCGTGASGSTSCALRYGTNTIQARNATTVIPPSVTATASCTSGTSWNTASGRCLAAAAPQCNDGINNDGDSWGADYPNDPGCSSATDTSENPNPACSNGADDDGDGNPDNLDPGCQDATGTYDPRDTNEGDEAACSDNIDNDGDGYTDFDGNGTPADADPGCTSATDTSEFNIGSIRPR